MNLPDNSPLLEQKESDKIHLIVLVHGFLGHPDHLKVIAEEIKNTHRGNFQFYFSSTNQRTLTFDGVDVCGNRLYQEILEVLKGKEKEFEKISLIGYSLGGLLARYVVGKLYEEGWFEKIQPVNFTTFACPHIGVVRKTSLLGTTLNFIFSHFGGRTGRQLMFEEAYEEESEPLLLSMAKPNHIYLQGLEKFYNIGCYANVHNDYTVPFCTAFICDHHDYRDFHTPYKKYPHVSKEKGTDIDNDVDELIEVADTSSPSFCTKIWIWTKFVGIFFLAVFFSPLLLSYLALLLAGTKITTYISDTRNSSYTSKFEKIDLTKFNNKVELRKSMITNLNSVKWKKFPVKLDAPHTHGMIVVRNPLVYSRGLDVIRHYAQTFFQL